MRLPAIFTGLNSEIVLSKLVLLEFTRCFIKKTILFVQILISYFEKECPKHPW